MRTAHRGCRIAIVCIALATVSCVRASSSVYQAPSTLVANAVWPGATWDSIRDPRTVGWTRSGLDSVRAVLSTKETTGRHAGRRPPLKVESYAPAV
jgi:hypothetical protein